MPLISRVGSRSLKVRALYTSLFVVLCIGAASMVYPLLIMLTGSMQSDADSYSVSPYPQFWFDDTILFRKFVESKYYDSPTSVEYHWGSRADSWETIQRPSPVPADILAAYLEWRNNYPLWELGFTAGGKMLPINGRLFRNRLFDRYKGDIEAMSKALDLPYNSWTQVAPPMPLATRISTPPSALRSVLDEFSRTRPPYERILPNLDAAFWQNYLIPKYTNNIAVYNQAHGTAYHSYSEVFLTPAAPAEPLQRADWDNFVRHDNDLKLAYIRLPSTPALVRAYGKHLQEVYGDIGVYNAKFAAHYAAFSDVPFPTVAPASPLEQVEWDAFIQDPNLCPTDAIGIFGPRQSFEAFVAARRGQSPQEVAPILLPVAQADEYDTRANSASLRWEFSTRNYKDVFGYVVLHGNGILNSIIFCALAIATNLLVNPLAAYALSRFKLPSTYTILLFCMATMAFPGEVTMIPKFLLLKSFPLWSLIAGTLSFAGVLLGLTRFLPRSPEILRLFVALAIGVGAGAWLLPAIIGPTHVSLLNTFAALILPGMASGFSIFLLKGFFDSLPIELFEAADIDGASEWTKFWMITMGLSKPILAVIGLGAFTSAYSQFMMALIIVPDPKMWPLMVWLFQLQSVGHQSVIYASLVVAAIPTLLVFIFCQNLIIRGIVVPVEK